MKKAIIIALLIAQANSMSFYDVFAPVEDSLGRLVSDVVTDIKDTIDCTILAVEQVFSLGGIFGRHSDYDEKCNGQRANNDVQTGDDSESDDTSSTDDDTYSTDDDTQDAPEEKPPNRTIKKVITDKIQESVSEASQRIQNILNNSDAHIKIENVKNTIKNETDRLVQVSALLKREVEKLPDEVRLKFKFNYDQPSIQDLFDEIKLLYQVEQRDKSSAEANEVRRAFDKVLDVLHVNDTDGFLSDEDEVALILKNLGKSSNESLIDIEKQVSLWTKEEQQQIADIKNVVVINNTISPVLEKQNKNNTDSSMLADKLNEIETQQSRMIDFSKSLKNVTNSILHKVGEKDSHNIRINATYTILPTNTSNLAIVSVTSAALQGKYNTTRSTAEDVLTEKSSVSPQSPVTLKYSPAVVSSTEVKLDVTKSSVSKLSPQNVSQAILSTTQLPTSTDTISISSGSWPSTPVLLQSTTTKQTSNDFSKSSAQSIELADTTTAFQFLTTTMSTIQSVNTNNQEKPTTQIPLTIIKYSSGHGTPQISNTQTNIVTQLSSGITIPSKQIITTSVQTLGSNIPSVNTATRTSESKAQQLEAVFQENVTPQPSEKDVQSSTDSPAGKQTLPVLTTTEIPKTFKELAQKILASKGPDDYADYKDYEDKENLDSIMDNLFGPRSAAEEKEAAESAKELIAESQKSSAILNDFFKKTDMSDAPSVFDDSSYFGF